MTVGRLLVALLLIAAFCLGAAVSYFNWTTVSFHYLAGQTELPLIALLLGSFVLGAVVMWLLNLVRFFGLSRDSRRQQRQIRDLDAELKNLRNLALDNPPAVPVAPSKSTAKNA